MLTVVQTGLQGGSSGLERSRSCPRSSPSPAKATRRSPDQPIFQQILWLPQLDDQLLHRADGRVGPRAVKLVREIAVAPPELLSSMATAPLRCSPVADRIFAFLAILPLLLYVVRRGWGVHVCFRVERGTDAPTYSGTKCRILSIARRNGSLRLHVSDAIQPTIPAAKTDSYQYDSLMPERERSGKFRGTRRSGGRYSTNRNTKRGRDSGK